MGRGQDAPAASTAHFGREPQTPTSPRAEVQAHDHHHLDVTSVSPRHPLGVPREARRDSLRGGNGPFWRSRSCRADNSTPTGRRAILGAPPPECRSRRPASLEAPRRAGTPPWDGIPGGAASLQSFHGDSSRPTRAPAVRGFGSTRGELLGSRPTGAWGQPERGVGGRGASRGGAPKTRPQKGQGQAAGSEGVSLPRWGTGVPPNRSPLRPCSDPMLGRSRAVRKHPERGPSTAGGCGGRRGEEEGKIPGLCQETEPEAWVRHSSGRPQISLYRTRPRAAHPWGDGGRGHAHPAQRTKLAC